MDFKISHVCAIFSLCAASFSAAAIGPLDEARDFVIAKSKEISLEQTGSAEFSMKYMAQATERAAEICQQPEASRTIANRISSEACDVVAEKLDSQRKLISGFSVSETKPKIAESEKKESKSRGNVMVLHAESDNKDYIFDIWPNHAYQGKGSVMEAFGEKAPKTKCYSSGEIQTVKKNDLTLKTNHFKCKDGEAITWEYSPENNVTAVTIGDKYGRATWVGFVNTSTNLNYEKSNDELSKWVFWSNSGPVLYPIERDNLPVVLAVVNTKTWLVSLIDMRKPGVPGATCFDGTPTQGIDDVAPLKINGKYVKFKAVCLGQVGILQPSTDSGKKYLNEAALSGGKVVVGLSDNDILTFPDSDVKDMKARVSEINAAM